VKVRYEDFGPTLAAEHLASDDGLEVHAETLRRWMKQASRAVAETTAAEAVSATARSEGALWGVSADGRQFS
jgi:hypothetical protein